MKRILLIPFLLIAFAGLGYAQANFKFERMSHDFGTVKAGEDTLWVDFKFTNDGSEPLVINDIKTSCDCTLAKWPKNAIQPGSSAIIKGGFKIKDKQGPFNKNLIILANTMPGTTFLTIKGDVLPPAIQSDVNK